MKKTKSLYKQVRSVPAYLMPAWWHVYDNGITSRSTDISEEVKQQKKDIQTLLRQIQRQLQKEAFEFEQSKGVLIPSKGKKKPRPIVIPSLKSRIVQRSILDVLQDNISIQKYLAFPYSFGGVKRPDGYDFSSLRGVPEAIETVARAIKSGCNYYIRSDIKSFFSHIPKQSVLKILSGEIKEPSFLDLIDRSMDVHLRNESDANIKSFLDLFPSKDVGVAQGSCLSPLMGNILLHDFDQVMNSGGVVCIRYIDDLLILAENKVLADKAFKEGKKILEGFGLNLHEKFDDPTKAAKGEIKKGIDFLGVTIQAGSIYPSKQARGKIIKEINDVFDASKKKRFASPSLKDTRDYTLVNTLKMSHNKLKGWGNQYSFCNNNTVFKQMDERLNKEIREYMSSYYAHMKTLDEAEKRKVLGVHALQDSKYEPIVWEDL